MSGETNGMSDERKKSDGPSRTVQRKTKEAASAGTKSAGNAGRVATKEAAAAGERARSSVESGRQAAVAATGHVAATAVTTWKVVKNRKAIAASIGAGLIGAVGAAFAAGRATAKPRTGPLTRLVHGRI
ncbi:hypothetical protein AB0O20_17955 [Streptomyces kronopolitis]|uniref:hypothetical protein n=1 Tax=Streptomyces kronopolitis TaxID=1612435 RepID=UPI003419ED74